MTASHTADVSRLSGVEPTRAAILGCMLAGMCTFLNVYDTQPLLPYLQRLYNTSAMAVSLTVSATIFAVALAAPFVGLLAESVGRKKVIVPSLVRTHRPDACWQPPRRTCGSSSSGASCKDCSCPA